MVEPNQTNEENNVEVDTTDMIEVHFNVGMTCGGCANACTRILNKIEGVENVSTDVPNHHITVIARNGTDPQDMLTALERWGSASGKHVELLST